MSEHESDWQKDWKAYKKTTPGKWEVEGAGGVHMDGTRDGYFIVVNGRRLNNPYFSHDDAVFIALAHEVWPAALEERARLEKRVRELEEHVRELERDLQDERWFHEDQENALNDLIKQLEAENARLRAALISAGAEITVALNGLQYPPDPEWTRRHAKAAQGVINEALAAQEEMKKNG